MNRKKKRGFFITLGRAIIALLCFLVLVVGATNFYVLTAGGENIVEPEEAGMQKADCILVLGASVLPDGSPSTILQERLDCAIELYFDGAAPKIVMSGDHGEANYNEVENMKAYAVSQGVPSEDIFCDHAGFSTYESMYRAQSIFGVESMIVVTQRYHLYRAVYTANGLGIDAVGVASDKHRFEQQWYFSLREIPARTKDFLQVLLEIPPSFDGEYINLDQSGDVTESL